MPNIMLAITNDSIHLGPIPFTLYRKDRNGNMVLFCKKGMPITDEHIATIARMTLPLFVSGNDMDDYLDYTFERIEEIIGNKNIGKGEKVSLLHKVASRALSRLASSKPTKEAIQHSQKFIKTTTEFIFNSPEVSMLLLDAAKSDSYFFYHSMTNCVLTILLAKDMNCFDRGTIYDLGLGALIMDVAIPQLNPEMGSQKEHFSPEQWNSVLQHPVSGYRMLKKLNSADIVLDMVLNHHERMDGSGYPDARTESELSMFVQIAMVADAYNILTSEKVYSHPEGHVYVLKTLLTQNKLFSPTVLNSLVNIVLPDKETMQKLLRS